MRIKASHDRGGPCHCLPLPAYTRGLRYAMWLRKVAVRKGADMTGTGKKLRVKELAGSVGASFITFTVMHGALAQQQRLCPVPTDVCTTSVCPEWLQCINAIPAPVHTNSMDNQILAAVLYQCFIVIDWTIIVSKRQIRGRFYRCTVPPYRVISAEPKQRWCCWSYTTQNCPGATPCISSSACTVKAFGPVRSSHAG